MYKVCLKSCIIHELLNIDNNNDNDCSNNKVDVFLSDVKSWFYITLDVVLVS